MTATRVAPYAFPLGNLTEESPARWAMVWTIATEGSLFVFLLFSYFYLAAQSRGPWPPTGPLGLTLALPNTFVLIASSIAYAWGDRGRQRGDQRALVRGVTVAIVLGLIFIIVQGIEWRNMPFHPRDSTFASLFFTITGFHGAHVIVGLLMLCAVRGWAGLGKFTAKQHLGVTLVGWYWHFVDIVWLFVFTSLYLSPRFAT
jgi:cytochrome c oxidase subunit III